MRRSYEKELLDLKDYSLEEYHDCLSQLGRIGRLLGGNAITLKELSTLMPKCHSLLDVGCGGGDFTAEVALAYPTKQIVGSDIDPEAIAYARQKWQGIPNLSFTETNLFDEKPKSFDIVTATLVCHHLNDSELCDFIKQAVVVAKRALVFNDLHRHRVAYLAFAGLIRFAFPNRLIFHDGPLSIKKAFVKKDWEEILQDLKNYQIKWKWPYRWIVRIDL